MPPKRIDDEERAPLLTSSSSSIRSNRSAPGHPVPSYSPSQDTSRLQTWSTPRNRGFPKTLAFGIVAGSALLSFCLFLTLLVGSFFPLDTDGSQLDNVFVFHGPTDINVINVTQDRIAVNVNGLAGLDVDKLLGIEAGYSHANDESSRGKGARWWQRLRAWSARNAIKALGPVQVESVTGLEIWTRGSQRHVQAFAADILDPIVIPFVNRESSNQHSLLLPGQTWSKFGSPTLPPVHIAIALQPVLPFPTLYALASKSIASGSLDLQVRVKRVVVTPQAQTWWRKWVRVEQSNVERDISIESEFCAVVGVP